MVAAGVATFAQLYAAQAVLPAIAESFDSSAPQVALTVSLATGGLAAFVLMWSGAADRFGRTRIMTCALIVSTVLGLAAPFSPDLVTLLVLRCAQGVALGGVPAVAVAYLAEEIHPEYLARVTGMHIAGNTVGGMSGRLVAGAVADVGGWRWGIAADSLLAAAAVVVFLVAVPPARGFTPQSRRTGEPGLGRRLLASLADPGLVALYCQALFLMGAFVTIYNYLGFRLLGEPFELSQVVVSLMFIAYLAGAVGSYLAGRASEMFRPRAVLLLGNAGMVVGAGVLLGASLVLVVVGLLLYTTSFFIAHATASAWVGRRATHARAQAAACYTLAYYVGSSLFGWLGGFVYEGPGWNAVVGYVAVLCVVAAVATLPLRAHRR